MGFMNSGTYWIICIVMFIIGLIAQVVSYFLEKKYKKKIDDYNKIGK